MAELKEPMNFFAVHYKSKTDGKVKRYCRQVSDYCAECGQKNEQHSDGCSKPKPLWFGAKGKEKGSTWLECAETVIASSEDEAWKHHKSHCKLSDE